MTEVKYFNYFLIKRTSICLLYSLEQTTLQGQNKVLKPANQNLNFILSCRIIYSEDQSLIFMQVYEKEISKILELQLWYNYLDLSVAQIA